MNNLYILIGKKEYKCTKNQGSQTFNLKPPHYDVHNDDDTNGLIKQGSQAMENWPFCNHNCIQEGNITPVGGCLFMGVLRHQFRLSFAPKLLSGRCQDPSILHQ